MADQPPEDAANAFYHRIFKMLHNDLTNTVAALRLNVGLLQVAVERASPLIPTPSRRFLKMTNNIEQTAARLEVLSRQMQRSVIGHIHPSFDIDLEDAIGISTIRILNNDRKRQATAHTYSDYEIDVLVLLNLRRVRLLMHHVRTITPTLYSFNMAGERMWAVTISEMDVINTHLKHSINLAVIFILEAREIVQSHLS